MINPSSLSELFEHTWGLLVRGGADKKHPYHFPSLATYGPQGIQQRIVVLRKVLPPERTLRCYSDARTQKIEDGKQHPTAGWLFYDHGSKEQIRVRSQITLHHEDSVARELWSTIPPGARGDYVGPIAPGTHTEAYTDNQPPDFREEPTEENTRVGFSNFVVINSKVTAIDYLKLRREGHLRAQFRWDKDRWHHYWTAP